VLERNTYTTSIYIDAPVAAVRQYLTDGMSLNEYTLYSRMHERVDETTWLGTASGYQTGLYYHVRYRDLGGIQIVEWHCGTELGKYYHVYPMLLVDPKYFGSNERGTYYHWISFVDPARATAMISQGLPTVHRSEARSLKGHLERRQGHRTAVRGSLELRPHTIYVDAPIEQAAAYLRDPANLTEWGYMLRRDGSALVDEYDRPCRIELTEHDLGEYRVIEHDTHYTSGEVVRCPLVLIPANYAFAQPGATGFVMHRVSAWPTSLERTIGKSAPDDYDTEAINAKRIIEANAGNLDAYARGCSYTPRKV
jgi:hypothetical protein